MKRTLTDPQLARAYECGENQIRRWRARNLPVESPEQLAAALLAPDRLGHTARLLSTASGMERAKREIAAARYTQPG